MYHRNDSNLSHKKFICENKTHFKSTIPDLRKNYTNIVPAECGKPEFRSNKLQLESFFQSISGTRNEATAWLEALQESVEDTTIPVSFQHFFR